MCADSPTLAITNSSRFTSSPRVMRLVWMPKMRRLVLASVGVRVGTGGRDEQGRVGEDKQEVGSMASVTWLHGSGHALLRETQ